MTSLIIFGASARAAACSALRAGLSPWCADLFADADLQRLCPAQAVTDYPRAFLDISKHAPAGPWLYTGALENHPHLVDAIAAHRPLWGNNGTALQEVRSPARLAACLREAGLTAPRVVRADDAFGASDMPHAPVFDRWLIKPLASAGGMRIAFWDGVRQVSERCYLQEFIEGEPCAAIYAAESDRVAFLGATLQLVGQSAFNARPFAYCGSIGPLQLSPALRAAFIKLGDVLVSKFHLRGVFGVDCVLRDDVPWPVEVNPRYTASVEVLELAQSVLAFAGNTGGSGGSSVVGKAIVFSAGEFIFPDQGPWLDSLEQPFEPGRVPAFADIPHAGSRIEEGHPILTVFARDETLAGCRQQLDARAANLLRQIANRSFTPLPSGERGEACSAKNVFL